MNWQNQNNKLQKSFQFNDFEEAMDFINQVADIARDMNHHPKIHNTFSNVDLWLSTHDEGDVVTDKDNEFAKRVDNIIELKKKSNANKEPKKHKIIKMYADGGSRGNPGPSASGFVLLDENDNVLVEKGEYLGITTNNQAEYQAVKFGLEEAKKTNAQEVDIYLDSMLVVRQMKGEWKIKNRDLWPIHQAIKELSTHFKVVKFTHVPREFNKLADAEVNKVLDREADKHKA